jgi:putative ABC transport system permease protein
MLVFRFYGVVAYSVTQRRHEIGVRIALCAESRHIFWFVMGRGLVLVLVGGALGVAGAFTLTRLLSAILYGVSARDPLIFAGVAIFLMSVAMAACYIPAQRATKVDPVVALRYE